MKHSMPSKPGLALAVLVALAACTHDEHGTHDPHGAHEEPGAHAAGDERAHARPAPEQGHADEVHLSPAALVASSVVLGTAEDHILAPTFRAPAQIAFNREGMAHVGCAVKGRVAEVRARLGDEVKAGDVLLVVESAELARAQSEYLSKKSASATAAPAVELARNAHERAKGLYEKAQGVALAEVQKRESELRAAEAGLAAARAAERAAESELQLLGFGPEKLARLGEGGAVDPRFEVKAPIAGQVIEREVTLGELVGPERDALLVLADTSKLWVLADVPESKSGAVAVGARARVLLGADQDHWCEGVVAFVSPALDPRTRSVRVRIEALDRHPELRPGVFAQAEIAASGEHAGPSTQVVSVPSDAVRTIEGRTIVFVPVAGEPGTFAARAVVLGRFVGGRVEIVRGLAAGETFVAEHGFVLEAELGKSGAKHEH